MGLALEGAQLAMTTEAIAETVRPTVRPTNIAASLDTTAPVKSGGQSNLIESLPQDVRELVCGVSAIRPAVFRRIEVRIESVVMNVSLVCRSAHKFS